MTELNENLITLSINMNETYIVLYNMEEIKLPCNEKKSCAYYLKLHIPYIEKLQ